jgi:hypothetical protein
VVHSLIKDFPMRKIVLAAVATSAVFALSACKGEEAAPAATEAASEAAPAADATSDAPAADATTEAAM